MPVLVRLDRDNGQSILFEGDASQQQLAEIGIVDGVLESVSGSLDDVFEIAQTFVVHLTESLGTLASAAVGALDTVKLELGVQVDATGNLYVAKGSAGANLKLTVAFKPTPRDTSTDAAS